MPITIIRANPNLLEQVAGELDRIANDIRQGRNSVNTAGNTVQNAWQSQFTFQFMESVSSTVRRIDASEQLVRDVARQLRIIAADVRREEQRLLTINLR